jgi:hypothetical protein
MREAWIGLTALDLISNFTQAAGPASGSVVGLGWYSVAPSALFPGTNLNLAAFPPPLSKTQFGEV